MEKKKFSNYCKKTQVPRIQSNTNNVKIVKINLFLAHKERTKQNVVIFFKNFAKSNNHRMPHRTSSTRNYYERKINDGWPKLKFLFFSVFGGAMARTLRVYH